jgi:hypothetical protein
MELLGVDGEPDCRKTAGDYGMFFVLLKSDGIFADNKR